MKSVESLVYCIILVLGVNAVRKQEMARLNPAIENVFYVFQDSR